MTLYANTAGQLEYQPTLNGQPYDPVNNGGVVSRLQLFTTTARTGTPLVDVGPAAKIGFGAYNFAVPATPTGTYYSIVTWSASSIDAPFNDASGVVTVYAIGGSLGSTSTYTGNPSTNAVDQIRLLLGDTDMSDPLLDDGAITYFVTTWVNPYSAAAAAAEQIAGQFAREVAYTGDGVSVGNDKLQDKYTALAATLRLQGKRIGKAVGPYAGGTSVSDVEFVLSQEDEIRIDFYTGMGDNRREGSSTDVGSATRADDPLLSNQNYGY